MRSRSPPAAWTKPPKLPPTKNFGVEARLPWIDLLVPGRLAGGPDGRERQRGRVVVSRQHPDHDTQIG